MKHDTLSPQCNGQKRGRWSVRWKDVVWFFNPFVVPSYFGVKLLLPSPVKRHLLPLNLEVNGCVRTYTFTLDDKLKEDNQNNDRRREFHVCEEEKVGHFIGRNWWQSKQSVCPASPVKKRRSQYHFLSFSSHHLFLLLSPLLLHTSFKSFLFNKKTNKTSDVKDTVLSRRERHFQERLFYCNRLLYHTRNNNNIIFKVWQQKFIRMRYGCCFAVWLSSETFVLSHFKFFTLYSSQLQRKLQKRSSVIDEKDMKTLPFLCHFFVVIKRKADSTRIDVIPGRFCPNHYFTLKKKRSMWSKWPNKMSFSKTKMIIDLQRELEFMEFHMHIRFFDVS